MYAPRDNDSLLAAWDKSNTDAPWASEEIADIDLLDLPLDI